MIYVWILAIKEIYSYVIFCVLQLEHIVNKHISLHKLGKA